MFFLFFYLLNIIFICILHKFIVLNANMQAIYSYTPPLVKSNRLSSRQPFQKEEISLSAFSKGTTSKLADLNFTLHS